MAAIMPIVNFKEIPQANTSSGEQDTFELFARDFLEEYGFEILQGPGRGADGGRDMILQEKRVGTGGETKLRWLVSCKHYVHCGKSIGVDNEANISDRLAAAKAHGVVCFYSTIASSSLITRLDEIKHQYEHIVFDREKIEGTLLRTMKGIKLFSRYFPESYRQWSVANPKKPQLYFENAQLLCEHCGKDLLKPENIDMSMLVMWEDSNIKIIDKVYCCCKGRCDDALKEKHTKEHCFDFWDELRDYSNPTQYILSVTTQLIRINEGQIFTEKALSQLKKFLIVMFHQVSRELTPKEEEDLKIQLNCGTV